MADKEVADRRTAAAYQRKKVYLEKAKWKVKENGTISDAGRLNVSPPPKPENVDMLASNTSVLGFQPILPRADRFQAANTRDQLRRWAERTERADDAGLESLMMSEPEVAADLDAAPILIGLQTI
ncbi:hypothetical protein SLA2020_368330 [Shorea laevis]